MIISAPTGEIQKEWGHIAYFLINKDRVGIDAAFSPIGKIEIITHRVLLTLKSGWGAVLQIGIMDLYKSKSAWAASYNFPK